MKKTILTVVFSVTLMRTQAQQGCSLTNSANNNLFSEMTSYSGNYSLDQFLAVEVQVLKNFFGVQPCVFYYNDVPPNAKSTLVGQSTMCPSGTIVLGKNLIINEFQIDANGTTIPIILAHEFGHTLDFTTQSVPVNERTKTKELFADFMAGAYLYYRNFFVWTNVEAAFVSFCNKGGYEFNNPDFHGTPQERVEALRAGYYWLQNTARPGINVTSYDAINAAKRYLRIR